MDLEQEAPSAPKISMLVVGKEATTLITLHGIANWVKIGQQEKLYPPTDASVSLAAVSSTTIFSQFLKSSSSYFYKQKLNSGN